MSSTPAPPPQDEGRGRKAGQRHCELRAMTRIASGFDDQQLSPSSSRKRGPITTGLSCFSTVAAPACSTTSACGYGSSLSRGRQGGSCARRQHAAFSRRVASELFIRTALIVSRGRREGRVPARTHGPRAEKSTRQNHRFSRNNRHSLRNGFTAYT